jgi:hypothetical protein
LDGQQIIPAGSKIVIATNSPSLNWWVDPSRGFLVDKPLTDTPFFVNRKEDRTSFMLKEDRIKGEYLGA